MRCAPSNKPAGDQTFLSLLRNVPSDARVVSPNFLYGDADTVEANIKQCAERIYFRLAMWNHPERVEQKHHATAAGTGSNARRRKNWTGLQRPYPSCGPMSPAMPSRRTRTGRSMNAADTKDTKPKTCLPKPEDSR